MDMDERFSKTHRWPTVSPLSSRTFYHPSFMPMYMAAASAHCSMNWTEHAEVPLVTPFQLFYDDGGRRIHNAVTDLRVFECFRLNTPPPVMSPLVAPPGQPDPFMAGAHPTRSLGSPRWRTPVGASLSPTRGVVQLTQDEDQAITTLLKLHYRDPNPSAHGHHFVHTAVRDEAPAEDMETELSPPGVSDDEHARRTQAAILESERCRARLWSDAELEAANTLLTLLSLIEECCPQNPRWSQPRGSTQSPHDLQNLLQEGHPPGDADIQPAPDAGLSPMSPRVCNCEFTQKYAARINFDSLGSTRFDNVNREPLGGDGLRVSHEGQVTATRSSDSEVERRPGVFVGVFGPREGTPAESEGTAVHALLSLWEPREFPAACSVSIDGGHYVAP